ALPSANRKPASSLDSLFHLEELPHFFHLCRREQPSCLQHDDWRWQVAGVYGVTKPPKAHPPRPCRSWKRQASPFFQFLHKSSSTNSMFSLYTRTDFDF